MKLEDIDKLNQGDIVVFIKTSSNINIHHDYKIGDELIFDRYDYMMDALFFIREMENNNAMSCQFSPKICKFIVTKNEWIRNTRNYKIDKILPKN